MKELRHKKLIGFIAAAALLSVLAAAVFFFFRFWFSRGGVPAPNSDNSLYVRILSVGDANAAVLTCGGETMLIDLGCESDAAHMKEVLTGLGVKKIDLLIITHAHYDHYGGCKALGEYKVEKCCISPYVSAAEGYTYALDYIAERCDDIIKPRVGDVFTFGGAEVTVLGPVERAADNSVNINETSLIVKLTFGDVAILFPGDAGSAEIDGVIAAGADLDADILLAAHHGSNAAGANSYLFLREVMPDCVIISCAGSGSNYGYPHEEVLSRLNDLGCRVLRTDSDGDIIIKIDGKKYELFTEK